MAMDMDRINTNSLQKYIFLKIVDVFTFQFDKLFIFLSFFSINLWLEMTHAACSIHHINLKPVSFNHSFSLPSLQTRSCN